MQQAKQTPRCGCGYWRPLLLTLLTAAVYANSFGGVFLFDDFKYFLNNPDMRDLSGFAWAVGNSRPVVYFTFALNYWLSGEATWSYHLFNLAFHLVSALTVLGILTRLLQQPCVTRRVRENAPDLAVAVALLWACHPAATMAVTYLWQRCESLASMFYLLTIYGAVRAADATSPTTKMRAGWWSAFAVLACAVGMASKEIVVTAPLVVWMIDRAFFAGGFVAALRTRASGYIALATTWGVVIVLRVVARGYHDNPGVGFSSPLFSPLEYMLTVPGVLLEYLRLVVWPHPLCFDPNWTYARMSDQITLPLILVSAGLIVTVYALIRRPQAGAAAAWFWLILAPTTSLMPMPDPFLEYRLYLPMMGILAGIVVGLFLLLTRSPRQRTDTIRAENPSTESCALAAPGVDGKITLFFAVMGILILVLAGLTMQRNRVYHSAEGLWADTLRQRPDNVRAFNQYWAQLMQRQQRTGAGGASAVAAIAAEFSARLQYASAEKDADYLREVYAVSLLQQGKYTRARKTFEALCAARPKYAFVRYQLGETCRLLSDDEAALQHFDAVIRLKPNYAQAYFGAGLIAVKQGAPDEAVKLFRHALRIWPKFYPAYFQLGILALAHDDLQVAAVHFQHVVKLSPRHTQAWHHLGVTWERLQQSTKAIRAYQQAIQADPNWTPSRERLRALENTQRDRE